LRSGTRHILGATASILVFLTQKLLATKPSEEDEEVPFGAPEAELEWRAQTPGGDQQVVEAKGIGGVPGLLLSALVLGGTLAQHWDHLVLYLWIALPATVLLFAAWWFRHELAVRNW
jgi:hypothetical protein